MPKYLIAVAIWLPVIAALLCYIGRSYVARNVVVFLTGIILAAVSIGLLMVGPFDYQPAGIFGIPWDEIIAVADYGLMALILYIGFKYRNSLIIVLTLIQVALLIYFDFAMGGGHAEVSPNFVIDNLSIIMSLIINIVGSLICIYGVRYIAEHEEHHKIISLLQNTGIDPIGQLFTLSTMAFAVISSCASWVIAEVWVRQKSIAWTKLRGLVMALNILTIVLPLLFICVLRYTYQWNS